MANTEIFLRNIFGTTRPNIRPLVLALNITNDLLFEQHMLRGIIILPLTSMRWRSMMNSLMYLSAVRKRRISATRDETTTAS